MIRKRGKHGSFLGFGRYCSELSSLTKGRFDSASFRGRTGYIHVLDSRLRGSASMRSTVLICIALAAGRSASAAVIVVCGDFDRNGEVNSADLLRWSPNFGKTDATANDGDSDSDKDVDGNDFLCWQRTIGPSTPANPATTSVPEPVSLALAALAMGAIQAYRRRQLR